MIDIANEQIITLSDAAERLPPCRKGRTISVGTLYRWASPRGCRGVRLETIRVGRARVTSVEALQRFCDRLTATTDGRAIRSSAGNQDGEATRLIDRELDAAGF